MAAQHALLPVVILSVGGDHELYCLQYLDHTVVPVLRAALKELVMKRYDPIAISAFCLSLHSLPASSVTLVYHSCYSSALCLPSLTPIECSNRLNPMLVQTLRVCIARLFCSSFWRLSLMLRIVLSPQANVLFFATGLKTPSAFWLPTSQTTSQSTRQQPPSLDAPTQVKQLLHSSTY